MIMYDPNLRLEIDPQLLMDEFEWYLNATGKCNLIQNRNKIVQCFQQDVYYKKEKELWLVPSVRNNLINNRCKYLKKSEDELTTFDLLIGFKRSGIYYGYSGFNPLLCKWFYNRCLVCSGQADASGQFSSITLNQGVYVFQSKVNSFKFFIK